MGLNIAEQDQFALKTTGKFADRGMHEFGSGVSIAKTLIAQVRFLNLDDRAIHGHCSTGVSLLMVMVHYAGSCAMFGT